MAQLEAWKKVKLEEVGNNRIARLATEHSCANLKIAILHGREAAIMDLVLNYPQPETHKSSV